MNVDLLKALGGRSDALVTLDFETYWDAKFKLRKMTTEGYVRDPRFEVIGVGVKVGSSPSVWLEEWEFRAWSAGVNWARVSTNAHHAHFDNFILSHHYGIKPRFILCTMSMARALHGASGVSLERLGPLYGLGEKGKEIEATKGKRRADFTQAEWLRFGDYCNNDVELTHGLLGKMTPGFPLEELWLVDLTVRCFTEPVFRGDQAILQRALIEERAKKAALLKRLAQTAGADPKTLLSSADKFAALLRKMGEEPPTKPNKKGKSIYAFAKTDPGMQMLVEHPTEEIRFLAEARLAVKSTIIETRTERIIGIANRGAIPFYLKYSGAHTHRWSGGDKMNPQNFNRGGDLRDAILAPPGHVLAVADSGQIEARFVAWFAGQVETVETFRRNDATGGDFYSDEGSRYFGKKLSKKETPTERQVSKSMVLGLGYQMGAFRFAGELLKGMLGAPPVQFTMREVNQFGVDLERFKLNYDGDEDTEKLARIRAMPSRISYEDRLIHCAVTDYFVQLYRRTNPRIKGLWKAMGEMLRVMEMPGGSPHAVRAKFGCCQFIYQGVVKPSGLVLHYPGLRRNAKGEFSYLGGKSGKERVKIYGGLLTENIVQSIARDAVAEQALWIRTRYDVKTTTHDEVVAVPPKAEGQACLDYMIARMKIAPAWCSTIPLNATGGVAERYGAAK